MVPAKLLLFEPLQEISKNNVCATSKAMRRSRNFRQGGPGQSDKKSSDNVFFFSAYFKEVKWSISKKSIIFKVPEGVQHFPGGSNFFQGGPTAYSL